MPRHGRQVADVAFENAEQLNKKQKVPFLCPPIVTVFRVLLFSWVQFASAVISRVKLYLEAIVCFIIVCFCCRARGLVAGGEGD